MKTNQFLSLLFLALFVFTGNFLTSCGGDDGDDSVNVENTSPSSPENYITVNGVESASLVFAGDFGGKGGDNFKQYVSVVSNVAWSITDAPDWLSISPSNGNGTVQIEIYPTSENATSSPRTATVRLSSSGGLSATIDVKQNAGKPLCVVEVANEVALYNRICWEYSIGGEVNTFNFLLLSEREYERMTDKEMIEEMNAQEPMKFSDSYIFMTGYDSHLYKITENSVYYIVSLATDAEGKTGELTKKKIITPAYIDATNDAWVYFDNITSGPLGFKFDTKKKGYCNTYHLIYGTLSVLKDPAIYAFQINYYLKYKKKHWYAEDWDLEIITNYPNDNTFTYVSLDMSDKPICAAYAWGVFENGTLSSDLMGFQWDTSANNIIHKSPSQQDDIQQNVIIKRSVEEQRASILCK